MGEVYLELEAITPVFISGADPKNIENEGIRPPSIRGLLRWWYRSLAGGMVNTAGQLLENENKIFGSTKVKSPIKVISKTTDRPKKIEQSLFRSYPNYLLFSIKLQNDKKERLQYYDKGSKFQVILQSEKDEELKIAAGAMWMLIYLGGIGARNRRGFGCLKVTDFKQTGIELPFNFINNASNINNLKQYMEGSLREIYSLYKKQLNYNGTYNNINNYCILNSSKLTLYKEENDLNRLFDDFKNVYKNFRNSERNRNRNNLKFLGLPIKNLSGERFASPLTFGVIELSNRKYAGRIIRFYSSTKEDKPEERNKLKALLERLRFEGEVDVNIPKVN